MPVANLVILGASVRAAAASAVRAGYLPWSADLFADVDTRQFGPAVKVLNYPEGLFQAARLAPAAPWIYTGGLENCATLVERTAAERPLLGNGGHVLRMVRDPWELGRRLRDQGISFPEVRGRHEKAPADGSWLCKPFDSSGGGRILRWRATDGAEPESTCRGYLQKHLDGEPISALFLAFGGDALLLGVSWQLIGHRWNAPAEFQYAGSIAPALPDHSPADGGALSLRQQWQRLGKVLAAEFGLRGLFGVDAILCGGVVWPIEVNPRYTASVEVIERATGIRAIELHVAACEGAACPGDSVDGLGETGPGGCCGKLVVFAPADLTVPVHIERCCSNDDDGWPVLTDLPAAGERIAAGRPVVTVHARAFDRHGVEGKLRRRANMATACLLGHSSSAAWE